MTNGGLGKKMQTGTIQRASRVDILLTGQASGATALFIYSGEVGCNFTSDSNTTLNDQLLIELPDADLLSGQLVQFQAGVSPIPIVLPTNWNSNSGFSVIGVNSARVDVHPENGRGLILVANVAVQNGMLVGVSYQVSVRVNLS